MSIKYLWANKNNGNINTLLSILPWTLRIETHDIRELMKLVSMQELIIWKNKLNESLSFTNGILTIKFDQPPSSRTDLAKLFGEIVW